MKDGVCSICDLLSLAQCESLFPNFKSSPLSLAQQKAHVDGLPTSKPSCNLARKSFKQPLWRQFIVKMSEYHPFVVIDCCDLFLHFDFGYHSFFHRSDISCVDFLAKGLSTILILFGWRRSPKYFFNSFLDCDVMVFVPFFI